MGGVGRAVYQMLRDHGPVVPHRVLFDAICGTGRAPNTLMAVLSRSPIVWRVAPGRYALIGQTVTHADIAATDASADIFNPAGALTFGIDGSVTYSVNAAPQLLYRGFLDTSSLAAFAGEWRMPTGERVVVDDHRVRGLKAGIRALGIAKGERIAVRFDTWTHTVTLARVTEHG